MVRDITIVSLSRGIMGESFVSHEIRIGLERLENMGISVHFASNALKGIDYLKNHPEARAEDLLEALQSNTDMILCAVGGDDTYRLLPYLFDHNELIKAVQKKIFLGFSDTTMNHFMLHKAGLNTFYGQAFLPDVCELDAQMLPYTRSYFEELVTTGTISEITPSDIWYESRKDFSPAAIGSASPKHANSGFQLLQGSSVFKGEILGGCLDTLYDMFNGDRYSDSPALCQKYHLFPSKEDWLGKILLIETSEEKATPRKFRLMIEALKKTGIFESITGILMGKPADEYCFEEYKRILCETVGNADLPILSNLNIGHSLPRCIIPFGVPAVVDAERQIITFEKENVTYPGKRLSNEETTASY